MDNNNLAGKLCKFKLSQENMIHLDTELLKELNQSDKKIQLGMDHKFYREIT